MPNQPASNRVRFAALAAVVVAMGITLVARAASATTQATADQQIVIDNFTFSPAEVTIAVGTKVTWTNHDDVPHTATSSDKPKVFSSGPLDTDATFSFTFKTPGNYPYYCTVHPHMTGRIIVK